ncbi:MAG: VTT domain-containing protein [Firmicutes bacterium]|nr:VTT domain-containing protein [Bacillota bacterium]
MKEEQNTELVTEEPQVASPAADVTVIFDEKSFRAKWKSERAQRVYRLLFVLGMLVGVAAASFFTFRHFGLNLNPLNPTDPEVLADMGFEIYLIFIALYIVQAVTLNIIPGTTTVFISVIGFTLFGQNLWITFAVAVVCKLFTIPILYALGRWGGRSLLFWIFGREKLEKRLDWIADNGARGVPWLFLVPMFPTDILCVACGAAKMKFWQYSLIAVVFRPIEVLLLISYSWGVPIIIESTTTWELFLLINVVILNFVFLVIYHKALLAWFNKTIKRRRYEDDLVAAKQAVLSAQKSGTLPNSTEGAVEPEDQCVCKCCGCRIPQNNQKKK